MIAFIIYDINVCGGTHKQLLKLIEYTERQGQDFIIITKKLDLDRTYEGFRRYKDKIFVLDYFNYPDILNHRLVRRLIPVYYWWKLHIKLRNILKKCDIINIHDNGCEDLYPLMVNKKVFWQINDLPSCFREGVSANREDTQQDFEARSRLKEQTQHFKAISVNVGKNAERVKRSFGREAYVFYCGVEPVGILRDIEQTYLRFEKKEINLLSSGVFFKYRNYETQVIVVRELKKRGYDVSLHIIGDTSRDREYAKEIQDLIDKEGIHNNVTIEGQIDDKRFKQLHENSDIFMFINVDQSWGLAVFEAMSCGLPVIVSNSVGATEILNDNQDSIFVDPKDVDMIVAKIEQLINDRSRYSQISHNASEFHKQWTWDKAYCSKMYNLMMDRLGDII